ncbi:glycosyltransferase family 2 protein [Hymenobacter sp. HD11105]
MSSDLPYRITHVYLHQEVLGPPEPRQHGHYLVFWWQELALGHLFVSPEQPLLPAAYYPALATAIAPAVQHYAARQHSSSAPDQALLARGDVAGWRAGMQAVLAPLLPSALPPQVPVSVIICTRDRATLLQRCLTMLRALPCAPTQIIVVDNAPADPSTREVVAAFDQVLYVAEPRPGLDIARNTGIRAAQEAIITFIDDDVVVHPWLMYRVWEAFEEPAVVALTGLILALSLQTAAQLTFERAWSFNRGYVDKIYGPEYVQQAGAAPRVWEIGAGANMAFRRAIFDQVGYFDELLDVGAAGCSGDSELWFRILRHGFPVHYTPRAIVYHEHRRDMRGLKRQLFYYMRGHVAAALTQHAQLPLAGYQRYLFWEVPRYYAHRFKVGFPFFCSPTLWAELTGVVSGLFYYYRTRRPSSE